VSKQDSYIISGIIIFLLILYLFSINNFFYDWSAITFNNIATPFVAIVTAIVLVQTLRQGQKQHKEGIAINQYNILLDDIKTLIKEFENLRFDLPKEIFSEKEIEEYKNTNGISYHNLFGWFFHKRDTTEIRATPFRNSIVFPLIRMYEKLLISLNEIKNDHLLSVNYKKKLFRKIEQDLLQSYLRFCNDTEDVTRKGYDFTVFGVGGFDHRLFFKVNDFYLSNKLEPTDKNLFQVHDIDFYKKLF